MKLGHLTPSDPSRTLARAAEKLSPGGVIIPDFSPGEPEPYVSEALERAAKAIGERMFVRNGGGTMMPWEFFPERRIALDYARAAFAALREPTAQMEEAGGVFLDAHEYECGVPAGPVWRAMIDEVLAIDAPLKS